MHSDLRHSIRLLLFVSSVLLVGAASLRAQVLRVYDVDASNFPMVSAEFDYYATGGARIEVPRDSFLVREFVDALPIEVFDCPQQIEPEVLSAVLMIDASSSMNQAGKLQMAQSAARAWIDAMPLGPGECALGVFSESNTILQDFTTNRAALLSAVDGITTQGGTQFDAAFTAQPGGALVVAESGINKRVVVLITDGDADGNRDEIIAAAQSAGATVFCVSIGIDIPPILFDIADATGGEVFDNVTSLDEASDTFVRILRLAQEVEPCKITWRSGPACETVREPLISIPTLGAVAFGHYNAPPESIPLLLVNPARLDFGPVPPPQFDQKQVELRAQAQEMTINSINVFHPDYSIVDWGGTAPPFTLAPDESRILTVEFRPADSSFSGHEFELEAEGPCNVSGITVFGGFPGIKPKIPTLKVTVPNGGEMFAAGETIEVSWTGVPRRDSLRLELSTNNGDDWTRITEYASGLSHELKLPNTVSDECLVRLSQGAVPEDIYNGWAWARRGGGFSSFAEEMRDICLDSTGNIYAVGSFFGDGDFAGTDISASGSSDIFLVKLRPDGSLAWVRNFGSREGDDGIAVGCDAEGNVYVGGEQRLSFLLDGKAFGGPGGIDLFLAKFNSSGTAQWISGGGGPLSDDFGDMVVTPDGRVYMCGSVVGEATFGEATIGSAGSGAIFVAQYATDGSLNWINANEGNFSFHARKMDLGTDGELVMAGSLLSNEMLDGIALDVRGGADIFMARLNPDNGKAQSAMVLGGTGNEFIAAIAVDPAGNVSVAGNFDAPLDLGTGALVSRGGTDFFVAQFDAADQPRWSMRGGGAMDDGADDLRASPDGTLHMVGTAEETFDLNGEAGQAEGRDILVAELTPDGELEWLRSVGGRFTQRARGVVYDQSDRLYFAGEFVFSTAIGADSLRALGNGDAMVAAMRINLKAAQTDVSDNLWSIVAPRFVAKVIDMGVLSLGTRRDSTVADWLENVGVFGMIIDSIRIEGPNAEDFALLSDVPAELSASASLDIQLEFVPSAVGLRRAEIAVYAAGLERHFELIGRAVQAKLGLVFDDDVIDFGAVALSRTRTLVQRSTVVNVSSDVIEFDAILIEEAGGGQFSVELPDPPVRLAPGESLELDLSFTPTRRGRGSADLLFYCGGLAGPVRLPMAGVGLDDIVLIPDFSAAAGEERTLELRLGRPLSAVEAASIASFRARIEFSSDLLVPRNGVGSVSAGVRSIEVSGSPAEGDVVLAQITVVAALGAAAQTPLVIAELEWLDDEGEVFDPGFAEVDGVFELVGMCEVGGTRLFSSGAGAAALTVPQPNPAAHSTTLRVHLIEAGEHRLEIYSIRGELERRRRLATDGPGAYDLTLDCSGLPNGRYIVVVRTPTQVLQRQLDVRR